MIYHYVNQNSISGLSLFWISFLQTNDYNSVEGGKNLLRDKAKNKNNKFEGEKWQSEKRVLAIR